MSLPLASIDAPIARRTALATTLLLPWVARAQEAAAPARAPDVPYVPTPMPVVQKMLEMAKVQRGNVVYDLGCGDGRIVTTAAKERGARGVGIDINPERIKEAKALAEANGVASRTRFTVADLFETDFSEADVVTLYLLPAINQKLRPQLWRQLKVGARVVSHSFTMGEAWPAERTEMAGGASIHLWTITERQKTAALRLGVRPVA
ncbi:MAG TPA: methyltransferase domain-containing protein [Methylibium sp.]|uniref:class I SAM-dependent methyltransferase n=1 Tax=Methylibium sp. TaxID=2067992 RepID=UPI002DBE2097|nr:methyltransferase domain-containing protein [Methylibium sp.]HEU4458592.1 methyltransferase domain-containing protein [Methylibium sp.]